MQDGRGRDKVERIQSELPDSFYVIDADDRILSWGGPAWERFALSNQGEDIAFKTLTGTRIYDHVAGHFTQRFLREFFIASRAQSEPRSRRYRCDSPSLRRMMEMTVRRETKGGLIVEHRLIGEVKSPISVRFEQARSVRSLRCSMCSRIKDTASTAWLEPDEAFPAGADIKVVHTVCADCRKGVSLRWPIKRMA